MLLKEANIILGLDNIMTHSINSSGYNAEYGLLGSNKSTDEKLKLFPKDGLDLVLGIQKRMFEETGKKVEVLIYGDGAFKNLVGQNKSLGTTPRRIVDLVGSLCDLTSGSGDKGTPVILIQGYFDNYAND